MNKGVIVIGIVVFAIMGIVIYQFITTNTDKKENDGWTEYNTGVNENKSATGTWGIQLIACYSDGSEDQLTDFSLEIKFREKEVSYFKYNLFVSVTGEGYNNYSVDLSGFNVVAALYDIDENLKWTSEVIPGKAHTVSLNGSWTNIYGIIVNANNFSLSDGEYSLVFIPEGSIDVRGIPNGNSYGGELPKEESIEFTVNTEKWIDVIFKSE